MTEFVQTRLDGARELDRVLRMLPREMRARELEGALMSAAGGLRTAFADAAPVVTGQAARAVARRRQRKTQYSATVLIGWFRKGFYLIWYEFGSSRQTAKPFARPTWDREAPPTLDRIGRALGDRLHRAARRLSGSYGRSGLGARRRRR